LLDQAGVLRYSGSVDDNAQTPAAVTSTYLKQAIAHLLAGSPIAATTTSPIGCSLKWRQN